MRCLQQGYWTMLYHFDPTQTELFINETPPSMNKVMFDTVITFIGGEMQEDVIHFYQNP